MPSHRHRNAPVLALLAASVLATTASGQVTLNQFGRGWYGQTGQPGPSSANYFVGDFETNPGDFRNWFAFDLSGVTGTVTAAELRLELPPSGFSSPTGSEEFMLHHYAGDVQELADGEAGVVGWTDLGSGPSFASRTVTADDQGQLLSFPLNGDGVASMQAALGGDWAVGGRITTLDGAENDEYVFAFTNSPAWRTELVLTLEGPECFLVVGHGPGASPFGPGSHVWQTQLGPILASYPVTLENLPEFVLPELGAVGAGLAKGGVGGGPGGVPEAQGTPGTSTGGAPAWLAGGLTLGVQVVMWNPGVFPELPEQVTHGLLLRVGADGTVMSKSYGQGTGMTVTAETAVNAEGQAVLRFPFTIPGM